MAAGHLLLLRTGLKDANWRYRMSLAGEWIGRVNGWLGAPGGGANLRSARRSVPVASGARSCARAGALTPALLDPLSAWGQSLKSSMQGRSTSGIQMIRRVAAEQAVAGEKLVMETRGQRADEAHPTPPAELGRQSTSFVKHLRDLALGE